MQSPGIEMTSWKKKKLSKLLELKLRFYFYTVKSYYIHNEERILGVIHFELN